MAIKKRGSGIASQAAALADQIADKPYGAAIDVEESNELVRTSITLPRSLLTVVEDLALSNKRSGLEPKNVSATIRLALEKYINNK